MKASREKIKLLIELSPTVEEADKTIEENYGFTTIAEKMAFINIFSGEPLSENLLVVGYLNKDKIELATSTNWMVRITKKV